MNNTLQARDLGLKLIKPKQHHNIQSKIDSGLKPKKNQLKDSQGGVEYFN